jgi:hypothetical protein
MTRRVDGRWAKGTSGNPDGRPPKGRTLAELLQKALGDTYLLNGQMLSRQEIMARLLADAVAFGRIEFPPDRTGQQRIHDLTPQLWLDMVKLVLSHIDGPPQPSVSHLTSELDAMLDFVIQTYGADRLAAPDGAGAPPD